MFKFEGSEQTQTFNLGKSQLKIRTYFLNEKEKKPGSIEIETSFLQLKNHNNSVCFKILTKIYINVCIFVRQSETKTGIPSS